jgi:hypothetical protein
LGSSGEFAVEFGDQAEPRGDGEFGAGGGKRGALRHRRAIDGEAGPPKRFEGRAQLRIVGPVVGPAQPRAQQHAADHFRAIETHAELAADVGGVHRGIGQPETGLVGGPAAFGEIDRTKTVRPALGGAYRSPACKMN